MLLLDSNIFIYAIQPDYAELRQWITERNISTSEISMVEVLGYHRLPDADEQDLNALFSITEILPVTRAISDKAILLRQQRKMSLGDALIAATALQYCYPLVTRNTSDFEWVEGIEVQNPLK